MTDRFLSGWGMAEKKINKLVIECRSYAEALIVKGNALSRSEMGYVNICTNKPYYNKMYYLTSYHGKDDYKAWFKKDYFILNR